MRRGLKSFAPRMRSRLSGFGETAIHDHDIEGAKPMSIPSPTEKATRVREMTEHIQEGGPTKYRELLAKDNKLFVRDRLLLYFPKGPEYEDGLFANNQSEESLPADGLLTGVGSMDGRDVFFMANDYTVKAGSIA